MVACNFGIFEYNRVKVSEYTVRAKQLCHFQL